MILHKIISIQNSSQKHTLLMALTVHAAVSGEEIVSKLVS